jgi:hypothetical protein
MKPLIDLSHHGELSPQEQLWMDEINNVSKKGGEPSQEAQDWFEQRRDKITLELLRSWTEGEAKRRWDISRKTGGFRTTNIRARRALIKRHEVLSSLEGGEPALVDCGNTAHMLKSFVRKGWIVFVGMQKVKQHSTGRKLYQITEEGRDEIRRLRDTEDLSDDTGGDVLPASVLMPQQSYFLEI